MCHDGRAGKQPVKRPQITEPPRLPTCQRTPESWHCRPVAGHRTAVRVTSSAAAAVTAVTAATDGHAPMRLASGCEPPIAARYSALSPAATPGPDVRYQSRAHQAPAAANSAPPSSRRPLQRATANPPTSPTAATAEEEILEVSVTALTLPTGVSHAGANGTLRRRGLGGDPVAQGQKMIQGASYPGNPLPPEDRRARRGCSRRDEREDLAGPGLALVVIEVNAGRPHGRKPCPQRLFRTPTAPSSRRPGDLRSSSSPPPGSPVPPPLLLPPGEPGRSTRPGAPGAGKAARPAPPSSPPPSGYRSRPRSSPTDTAAGHRACTRRWSPAPRPRYAAPSAHQMPRRSRSRC